MRLHEILTEMSTPLLRDAEGEIKQLFNDIGIRAEFTHHFEVRATDGSVDSHNRERGSAIDYVELLAVINRLKQTHAMDLEKYSNTDKLMVLVTDALTKLNIVFSLFYSKKYKKPVVRLITIMKKRNFTPGSNINSVIKT